MKCEEARGYYYDCMDGQCEDEIPQSVQMHIGHCDHCREEIQRLSQALRSPSTLDSEEASHVSMINALLEMHFKYAETPVTCALAKRFLPSMAALGTRITIPTPITVHIEQCSKCRNDWIELQSLNLSDVQLQRLTECIEKRSVHAASSLRQHLSNEQVQTFACVDYADLDVACLEHVCECGSCRKRTLTVRQTVAGQLLDELRTCQEVSWEDLFDLALPLGFNHLVDEYAQFRKATVDHVSHCETCLRRLGILDQVLINFLPPHECGVVTHFQFVLDGTQSQAEVEYEDYPIRIDVEDSPRPCLPEGEEEPNPVSGPVPFHSRRGWMNVAAAAVVLLGMTLFSVLPRAQAGFWDQVYEATTSEPVVHITMSTAGRSGASDEYWILPSERAVVLTGQTRIDYNVSAGSKKTMDMKTGEVKVLELSGDHKDSVQGNIRDLYGLWSFEVSESATLVPDAQEQFDVYEARLSDGQITEVWRATVDRDNQRIKQVERLGRVYKFDYPSMSTFEAFLQQKQLDPLGSDIATR
ncbi:MAG: hypothetical protein HQ515_11850 [Phycisphaeraceae bacterium]|nr:hypothetical protein [Phycisphaeraceae bacterium]